ncbi:MAG: glycoside hydrolase family 3 N-terminal domain-containing protein [Gemmatimonadota bacterium]
MRRCLVAGIALLGTLGCGRRQPLYHDATAPIDLRVTDLLNRMTREEKFWQLFALADNIDPTRDSLQHGLFGVQWRGSASDSVHPTAREYAHHINALQRYFVEQTRLGIPIIPFEEGLHGLTLPDASVFPQAIGLAASWDTSLMSRVSTTIAAEARSRGVRQVLSPVINLATDVRWGRTEETYGEDPLLTGAMGVAFIRSFEQAGVITTPKHFVANVGAGGRDSYPVELGRGAVAEALMHPFEDAVHEGGARSLMAAYNSVNGEPASASRWLLTDVLRTEWGFEGFVISDAGGVGGANVLHNTATSYAEAGARAIGAGLDVIFQTSVRHGRLFWPAFADGTIPDRALDKAVARVLRAKFQLGLFEHPYVSEESAGSAAPSDASRALAREAAAASLVLLRNERHTLPLSPGIRSVAVIGEDAAAARLGGYSGPGVGRVSILDGIRAALPASAVVRYEAGVPRTAPGLLPIADSAFGPGLSAEYFDNITLAGAPRLARTDHNLSFSWPFGGPDSSFAYGWYSARWAGTVTAPAGSPMRLAVTGDDGYRLYLDDVLVLDRWQKESAHTDVAATPLVPGRAYRIRVEYFESGGTGQIALKWQPKEDDAWQGGIARAVNAARGSDAVVLVAGIEEGEFRDRASLRLPGHQEELIRAVAATGRPLAVVLVGGSAITMSEWVDRADAILLAWYPGEQGGHAVADALFGKSNPAGRLPITFPMAEGQLPLSYWHLPTGRGDDYADLSGRPLFPFGHGLSYSRFEYSDLSVASGNLLSGESVTVTFRITNRGPHDGDEVPQVYLRSSVGGIAQPVLALAAFTRVHLKAGESQQVSLRLPAQRFEVIDATGQRAVKPGRFVILVGTSSADLRLRTEFVIGQNH